MGVGGLIIKIIREDNITEPKTHLNSFLKNVQALNLKNEKANHFTPLNLCQSYQTGMLSKCDAEVYLME